MNMMFYHVIYMTFCHRYLNTSWRSENIGHTLEEEANQRGQRSSGHRPALKDYWVIIGVNQRKERNSHQVGKVVQLVLAPLVLSTQSRRGDHMICRREFELGSRHLQSKAQEEPQAAEEKQKSGWHFKLTIKGEWTAEHGDFQKMYFTCSDASFGQTKTVCDIPCTKEWEKIRYLD